MNQAQAPRSPLTLLALTLVLPLAAAQRGGIDVPGQVGELPLLQPAHEAPPSHRLGLKGAAEALRFEVPDIDWERVWTEDALSSNGPLRIGVERTLDVTTAAHPEGWFDVRGGRIWTATFTAAEAKGLRLRFEGLALPEGAELWIYGAGALEYVQGPITGRGPSQDGTLWSTDLYSSEVSVELFVPGGHVAELSIPAAQFLYRTAFEPSAGDQMLGAGSCHNDVMCYPTWQPLHNATCRITFVDGGTFLCSATLLATTAADQSPYLLTANHCVSNDTVGATVTANFFYQTVSCNGANNPASTTTHCDVLATNSAVDITLMMLDGALPGGNTWSGWSTGTNNNGTQVTAIHHPAGARKKLTLGSLITHPFGDSTHYYGITWSSGTIEGGTSGSGVWRNSNQLLIGVASHSTTPIDCTNPDGPSGYGRFAWFYNNVSGVSGLMAVGTDDTREPNDSCAAANTIVAGTYTNLVVKRADEDWYSISVGACKRLDVSLASDQDWGDVDLELRATCAGAVVASNTSNQGNKTLSYVNTSGATQTVKLRVFCGADDADTRNVYGLTLALSEDPLCGCPTPVTFCQTAPNSGGPGAVMDWSGSPRVALNSLVLKSYGLPPNKTCLYFYGQNTVSPVVFGNGWRCIGSPLYRLPATTSDFVGDVVFPLNLNSLPSGGQISAGQTWGFQCWYRDPPAGGAFYNVSDGLLVTFCP